MEMTKRILTGAMALTLALGSMALPESVLTKSINDMAISASAETSGDYEYEVLDDGTVEITDYYGSDTDITIPSTISGKKVTSIGDDAFNWCTSLTSVTIPNSVTSIGDDAFNWCTSLTSITIPNSVISIGDCAFSGCHSLTSITIGNSVTRIGYGVFQYCNNLTNVIIPNSVTSIGDYAFESCTSLTSITIGNSVTSIGDCAFSGCYSLTSITVDLDNKNYSSQDGVLFNKDKTELIQYPIGNTRTSYSIPNSVTSIDDYAFEWCNLTSLTIPNSVTSIGDYAFYDCESLTSITIPKSVTSIGYRAFECCASLTSITIPDSITSIGYRAFLSCTSLTSITIPDSVTSIGDEAFESCTSLTSITIPDSVTSIGEKEFALCNSLTSVTIGNSVTSIGYMAFYGCNGLTSITIPDSVTSIDDGAFHNCASLTSITIGNSVTSIGFYAFRNCSNLTSITIPKSVTSIGDDAFGYWNYEKVENFKIKCYAGTAGEQYAITHGFEYELIDQAEISGKIYYQLRTDGTSAVRFIAEVNIQDVQNSNTSKVAVVSNGETIDLNIKNAYYSIIAGGKKIEAPEGKCYIITPKILTTGDGGDIISAEFTLDSCSGSIKEKLQFNLSDCTYITIKGSVPIRGQTLFCLTKTPSCAGGKEKI